MPLISPYRMPTSYKPPALPQQNNSWNWNQSNPFKLQAPQTAGMGSSFQGAPTQNFAGPKMPEMGSSFTPPQPTNYSFGGNLGAPAMGSSFTPAAAAPNPTNYQAPPMPDMGSSFEPNPGPAAGLTLPYATRDNLGGYGSGFNKEFKIDDYLNSDAYKWQLDQGTRALRASLNSRGLTDSGAEMTGITDYAQGLASTYYDNAYNRFKDDRNFAADDQRTAFNQMTGDRRNMVSNYWDTYNANADDVWKTNTMNWATTTYANEDFQKRLMDWYNQTKGISDTGANAANSAGDIQANLAAAIAALQGNRGNVQASQAVQGGNNNSGLIDGLISILGLLG